MVASVADRASYRLKTVTSQGLFQARAATSLSVVVAVGSSTLSPRRFHVPMSTTTTSHDTGQRLRTTMAAVKLAFTWLGVRKTLAPEQRTTAARAFHADRELLSAG